MPVNIQNVIYVVELYQNSFEFPRFSGTVRFCSLNIEESGPLICMVSTRMASESSFHVDESVYGNADNMNWSSFYMGSLCDSISKLKLRGFPHELKVFECYSNIDIRSIIADQLCRKNYNLMYLIYISSVQE